MTVTTNSQDDTRPATLAQVRDLIQSMFGGNKKTDATTDRVEPAPKKTGDDGELSDIAKSRIIDSELKAEALKLGLSDLDFLKLIDRSKLRVTKDGVDGTEAALAQLKESKPSLFPTASTSSASTAPKAGEQTAFDATKATPDEIAKRLAQLSARKR